VKKRDHPFLLTFPKRLAYDRRPLGPAGIPGSSIQAYEVFESILMAILSGQSVGCFWWEHPNGKQSYLRGREALAQLDFYVQTELFMTPSAELADIVLPAATFYESFHTRLGFPNLLSSRRWIQYRPRVIPPLYETRTDMEILFDLACRLGLAGHFWDGDIEKAFDNQLKLLGLTIDDLKRSPCGVGIDLPMAYEKYRQGDSPSGTPRGFKTSSRKVEIFSQRFKDYGYDPLPVYREPMVSPESRRDLLEKYPFILTCSKLLPFCHGQHRSVPSLRKMVPHPFVEIHPETAKELGILEGEWVSLETPEGKIRVTLINRSDWSTDGLHPTRWWPIIDAQKEGLPGYDPISS
jgi:anaerobic selenocysteine-containing dehydrogenase